MQAHSASGGKENHKGVFPDKAAVTKFVTGLREDVAQMHRDLTRAGIDVSYETVKNWYYKPPGEMAATNLLRVVIALGVEKRFYEWIRGFRASPGAKPGTGHPTTGGDAGKGARDAG